MAWGKSSPRDALAKARALLERPLSESNDEVLNSARYAAEGALKALDLGDPDTPEALRLLTLALASLTARQAPVRLDGSLDRAADVLVRSMLIKDWDGVSWSRLAKAVAQLMMAIVREPASQRSRLVASLEPAMELWLERTDTFSSAISMMLVTAPASDTHLQFLTPIAENFVERRLAGGASLLEFRGVERYLVRVEGAGRADLLDACIARGREELVAAKSGRSFAGRDASLALTLAAFLAARFGLGRDFADLTEALSLAEDARERGEAPALRRLADVQLAELLRLRYEHSGDLAVLDRAIALTDPGLDLNDRHLQWAWGMRRGEFYARKFGATGAFWDLEQALLSYGKALEEAEATGVPGDLAAILQRIAVVLLTQGQEFRRPEAIEQGAEYARRSVELARSASDGDVLINCLDTLVGAAVGMQSGADAGGVGLGEALAACDELLQLAGSGHPRRAVFVGKAAQLHYLHYRATTEESSLERAISLGGRAVSLTGVNELGYPRRCDTLARAMLARGKATSDSADVTAAERLWEQAVASASPDVVARFLAAMHWADALEEQGDWQRFELALTQGMELLESIADSVHGERKRLRDLHRGFGVAGAAAAAALELGNDAGAIRHLERGRNLLWSRRRARVDRASTSPGVGRDGQPVTSLRQQDVMDRLAEKSRILGRDGAHPHVYIKAAEHWRLLGDDRRSWELLAMAALAYRRLEDSRRAIDLYQSVLAESSAARSDDDLRFRAAVLLNAGFAYRDLEYWEEGRRLYEDSLSISKRLGDPVGVARASSNLAGALLKDDVAEPRALELLETAAEHFVDLGEWARVATSLHAAAWTLFDLRRYPEAFRLAQRCRAAVERAPDLGQMQEVTSSLGQLFAALAQENPAYRTAAGPSE